MRIPYILLDFSGEVNSMGSQWDMAMIADILNGQMWQPSQGYEFKKEGGYASLMAEIRHYGTKGAIFVIPARQNVGYEEKINDYLKSYDWCLVILCGDEERKFNLELLNHPKMKVWLMQPRLDDKADFYIGSGYPYQARELLKASKPDYIFKPLDWSFLGQNNHGRRAAAIEVLTRMLNREDMKGRLEPSRGFTQGVSHDAYYHALAGSKAAPAPSGIESPDSFRVYEALEAGVVPIADDISRLVPDAGYWRKVFNHEDIPFKVLANYADLEGYIGDITRDYPHLQNKVFGWWQKYKRRMVYTLAEHINELSGLLYHSDDIANKITVLILTSPIKSHPSTAIIDQTITDIRKVLPDCEILIGVDGVREEQKDYTERYEEYKKRLLWKSNFEWSNVLPVIFEEHKHQAFMTRELLKMVKTPTILFVEHDTALAPDFEYDWHKFVAAIETGSAYTIRFHFEAVIPEAHQHLMIGGVEDICGLPLLKTAQWSQRPHLSSTAFYRDMMERYFNDDSRTMIEDKVHGFPAELYRTEGMQGWYQWRLWIYHPEGHIKRSYTTDGRGDDPKFEMRF